MKKIKIISLCAIFSLLLSAPLLPVIVLEEGDEGYVGVASCKQCHSGPAKGHVYEKWAKTSHTKSYERLVGREKHKDPKCLACHVTGLDKGGYKVGAPDAAKFEGVQCESCHGPGAYHIELVHSAAEDAVVDDYRIKMPTEETCVKCHDMWESPGFVYKDYLKAINHKYTDKKSDKKSDKKK